MVGVVHAVALAKHPDVTPGIVATVRAAILRLGLDVRPAVVEKLALEVEPRAGRARRRVAILALHHERSRAAVDAVAAGDNLGLDRRGRLHLDAHGAAGRALQRAHRRTHEIEARAARVRHAEELALRAGARESTPVAQLPAENHLEEEHGRSVLGGGFRRRGFAVGLVVGGGAVRGEREGDVAARIGAVLERAVREFRHRAGATHVEFRGGIANRAPVPAGGGVEDPRAEHDREDHAVQISRAGFAAGEDVDRTREYVLTVRVVRKTGLEGARAAAPPLDIIRQAGHVRVASRRDGRSGIGNGGLGV